MQWSACTQSQALIKQADLLVVDDLEGTLVGVPSSAGTHGVDNPYMAQLIGNTRITSADHFQDTRHIELSLHNSGLTYEPGDLLAIHPQQDPHMLHQFWDRTALNPSARVRVSAVGGADGAPSVQVSSCYHLHWAVVVSRSVSCSTQFPQRQTSSAILLF